MSIAVRSVAIMTSSCALKASKISRFCLVGVIIYRYCLKINNVVKSEKYNAHAKTICVEQGLQPLFDRVHGFHLSNPPITPCVRVIWLYAGDGIGNPSRMCHQIDGEVQMDGDVARNLLWIVKRKTDGVHVSADCRHRAVFLLQSSLNSCILIIDILADP